MKPLLIIDLIDEIGKPGLQEVAERRFDEGLENPLIEAQVAEALEKNVGKDAGKYPPI